LDAVKALIALGADVNAQNYYGHTALMEAADNGNLEEVRFLLDKGADVTTWAHGRTALKIARNKGYKEIAEILRAHGAKD